jgi:hypothetical protein
VITFLHCLYYKDFPVKRFKTDDKLPLRDAQKQIIAKDEGITLIVIPFWWEFTEESLCKRIALQRPDLFPAFYNANIPLNPVPHKVRIKN